jgi:hypothetical protein
MIKRIFTFSNFALLVALTLSSIAAWYSIVGLTSIFAGAVFPIIIMGSILELSKIVTTVWLKLYWDRASLAIKLYLIPAVVALALLTSMGIFGFLSKAHSDQGLVSGDVAAKIAVYDEKIKTEKENIEANRKALKQMDEGVDQVLGRSTTETGAEKAVAMRKSQQKERTRLQNEILQSQKSIAGLNNERAPIAAEVRKVEAEVGPIKYIAALIYGDNPDGNLLERAVRWVIILIVLVFDPLALMLVIAANQSRVWDREDSDKEEPIKEKIETEYVKWPGGQSPLYNSDGSLYEPDDGPISEEVLDALRERAKEDLPQGETITKSELFPEDDDKLGPCYKCGTPLMDAPGIGPFCPNKNCDVVDNTDGIEWEFTKPETKKPNFGNGNYTFSEPVVRYATSQPNIEIRKEPTVNDETTVDSTEPILTEGVTVEKPYQILDGGYVVYEGKHMHMDVLKNMRPDVLKLVADNERQSNTSFGVEFPKIAIKGDTFVRVDVLPNRVYKFDGLRWIVVNKNISTSYLHDQEYIKYLIQKIDNGEYDIDLLSESEKQQIEDYLTKKDDKN